MIPENNVPYLQQAIDADVQAAYLNMLKGDKTHRIKRLAELSGIEPRFSEKGVQAIYGWHAARGHVDEIRKIKEITQIRPKFRDKDVQDGYNYLIVCGSRKKILELQELTNVRLSPEYLIVQTGYRTIFYNSDVIDSAQEAKLLRDITGMPPSEEVLKKYPQFARVLQ